MPPERSPSLPPGPFPAAASAPSAAPARRQRSVEGAGGDREVLLEALVFFGLWSGFLEFFVFFLVFGCWCWFMELGTQRFMGLVFLVF